VWERPGQEGVSARGHTCVSAIVVQ
jgi:hypothetical protein